MTSLAKEKGEGELADQDDKTGKRISARQSLAIA